jgi:hypothetical protein
MITGQQSALQPLRDRGVLLSHDAVVSGEMRFDEVVRRWPAAISVLAAYLRRHPTGPVTPDLPLRSIAAACGIPLEALLAELADVAAREARGECIWTCGCR